VRAHWPLGLAGPVQIGVLTVFMAKSVDIAILIAVLLRAWPGGALIMKLNGKFRILLEEGLSYVAELGHTMLYRRSQII
jgi:hypothetical protein